MAISEFIVRQMQMVDAAGNETINKLGSTGQEVLVSDGAGGTLTLQAKLNIIDESFVSGGFTGTLSTSATGQSVITEPISSNAAIVLHDLARTGNWNDIVDKPATFTPSAHVHTVSDVTGLQNTLDGLLNGLPVWNSSEFKLTFNTLDGGSLEIDLPLESLAKDFDFDPLTNEIVITKQDGSTIRVDVSDLMSVYTAAPGGGLSLVDGAFGHTNVTTPGTLGMGAGADIELTFGGTLDIPYATFDGNGHITGIGNRTIVMPDAPSTVDSVDLTVSSTGTANVVSILTGESDATDNMFKKDLAVSGGLTITPNATTITIAHPESHDVGILASTVSNVGKVPFVVDDGSGSISTQWEDVIVGSITKPVNLKPGQVWMKQEPA